MKNLWLAIILAFIAPAALAQGGSTAGLSTGGTALHVGAPSGSCAPGNLSTNTSASSNQLYYCNASGSWVNITGGGTFTAAGDLTGSSSSQAVVGINGVLLSGLATGLYKFTSGVPSVAAPGTDYVVPSGSITGSAAKWTTPRNLAGNSVDGSADVAFTNKFIVQGTADAGLTGAQFLGALGSGFVFNTTTTGALSIGTATQLSTLVQGLTGCNNAGFVYTPQANDCVAAGVGTVTVTGSPASGNLALFSGGTSITNGNLSGDVLTVNTLAASVKQAHWNETAITNASSPYTVLATDVVITCNATAGAVTINLPAATGSGDYLIIKKTDSSANVCTPTRNGSDTIDGATSYSLSSQYSASTLIDTASGVWSRMLTNQLLGDVTGVSTANTVVALNGTNLAGLATGFLKITAGVPSSVPATSLVTLDQVGNLAASATQTFAANAGWTLAGAAGSTAVPLTVTGSLTGSQTIATLSVGCTWNTTGVVDACLLVQITNSASGAASKAFDIQLPGGTTIFNIDKAGNFNTSGNTTWTSGGAVTITAAGNITLSPNSGSEVLNVAGSTSGIGYVFKEAAGSPTGDSYRTTNNSNTVLQKIDHSGNVFAPAFYNFTTLNLLISGAAPTISSGFGTGASIASNNGTASFTVNVGTGATATSGVVGMPTAATGWICAVNDLTARSGGSATGETYETATTTTTVTITNQALATGVATAWAASDIIQMSCHAY